MVSTHSRLKAAGRVVTVKTIERRVSTHSRLKAAAAQRVEQKNAVGFNTQPPEGGWGAE